MKENTDMVKWVQYIFKVRLTIASVGSLMGIGGNRYNASRACIIQKTGLKLGQ